MAGASACDRLKGPEFQFGSYSLLFCLGRGLSPDQVRQHAGVDLADPSRMNTQVSTQQFGDAGSSKCRPDVVAATISVQRWKRVLDLVLLLLLSPVVVPVGLFIALYIKLVSNGPVLFSQTRIGFNGKPFICYKFRSMKINACVKGHAQHLENLMKSGVPMTKLDSTGDSRLIPGAAILRASGLDELAQLLNVLKGDMSIVGPRPCLPYEFALYNDRHRRRLSALPGITGYWQVNGKNKTTFEEMISLDIEYTQKQSPALDVIIIFKTFFVLARQLTEAAFSKRSKQTNSSRSGEAPDRGPGQKHADK